MMAYLRLLDSVFVLALVSARFANPQGTVPVFQHAESGGSYRLLGRDPAHGGTTTIPTVLVPITLSFETTNSAGKRFFMDSMADVKAVLHSPVFSNFSFPMGGTTQYGDAMLRATFPKANRWHTLLGKPEVKPVHIDVPAGYGYVLKSTRAGASLAVVDVQFLQRELFRQIPKQDGKLVIAVARNTTFYGDGDATVCCSWGTHGVDSTTQNSFVLASYLRASPDIIAELDVQPLTQQLAEFVNDPINNPLEADGTGQHAGNAFPRWLRPVSMRPGDAGRCGGDGVASAYFLLEPTDTNPKNNVPQSKAFSVSADGTTYHVQNVALLPWYTGADGPFSFPDASALPHAAEACPARAKRQSLSDVEPTVAPEPTRALSSGHQLIGYWEGYGAAGSTFRLRDVAPQWDVIIVAFATPDKTAPEGTMRFETPAGFDTRQFQSDIKYLRGRGKKVLISLGGGGQHFTLADPMRVPNYVSSVTHIVSEYGFNGIDIDFESPSLAIAAGDKDFKNPTTPSIVNLISALRQLHDHFGPEFMISLVPEGTQIPAGYVSYGGQFGSYLAIAYGIRDILSFMDVQDYNTPPLEGLDGEIYQAGTVDYHAAMTELVLHGFNAGGDPDHFFPAFPSDKIAVGFLTGDTTPTVVAEAMRYIITGERPAGASYKLRSSDGYADMIGAMFWTINADRRENYRFSNVVGPELHGFGGRAK